jgi:hypothetical protein
MLLPPAVGVGCQEGEDGCCPVRPEVSRSSLLKDGVFILGGEAFFMTVFGGDSVPGAEWLTLRLPGGLVLETNCSKVWHSACQEGGEGQAPEAEMPTLGNKAASSATKASCISIPLKWLTVRLWGEAVGSLPGRPTPADFSGS